MSSIETARIPYAAALLARLRARRGAGLKPSDELLDQIDALLDGVVGARQQLEARNRLIRRAALLLPPMCLARQADELFKQAGALSRLRTQNPAEPFPVEPATVRECLHSASLHGRLVNSQRQFLRILDRTASGD